jgi:signal transduction histidine kinase
VELAVSDDGRGFDAATWPGRAFNGHFGLLAMREQVQIARGSFEVTSQPGRGTVVRATLPTVRP